jgi:hypothetical protein
MLDLDIGKRNPVAPDRQNPPSSLVQRVICWALLYVHLRRGGCVSFQDPYHDLLMLSFFHAGLAPLLIFGSSKTWIPGTHRRQDSKP